MLKCKYCGAVSEPSANGEGFTVTLCQCQQSFESYRDQQRLRAEARAQQANRALIRPPVTPTKMPK